MKLVLPGINSVIYWEENKLSTLVVEKPALLYHIVRDIKQQVDKQSGIAVLSQNNEMLDIAKKVELVTDVYGINLNSKIVLNKILDELSQKAVDENNYEKTMQLINMIQSYIDDLVWDMECDIVCDDILPKQIFKMADITIIDDEDDLSMRILRYIEVIRQFVGDKLFIFVNLRGFLENEKFDLLAKTMIEHDAKVLFIDNKEYPICSFENRLIVDADLCEF